MAEPDDDAFTQLAARAEHGSALIGAFHQAEQRWLLAGLNGDPDEEHTTSTDVVARAWAQLTEQQQADEMPVLFNAFYHNTLDVRRRLQRDQMADDAMSYLQDGDLDIIDNTLSGALALSDQPLDTLFPGGMLPVEIGLLQRLVWELELLQHRLDTREQNTGGHQ